MMLPLHTTKLALAELSLVKGFAEAYQADGDQQAQQTATVRIQAKQPTTPELEVTKESHSTLVPHSISGIKNNCPAIAIMAKCSLMYTLPDLLVFPCSSSVVCVRYGLVYPGVGWIVWRNRSCVDESLIFHVNYLGTDQPSLNLNFSKNANMIVAQYYQVSLA